MFIRAGPENSILTGISQVQTIFLAWGVFGLFLSEARVSSEISKKYKQSLGSGEAMSAKLLAERDDEVERKSLDVLRQLWAPLLGIVVFLNLGLFLYATSIGHSNSILSLVSNQLYTTLFAGVFTVTLILSGRRVNH